jgi:integrase/recombinase XerD
LKIIRKSKYIPFIIDDSLFKKICNYIDETSKCEIDNYKYIYPVLYRLLYSTGIRINEALSLEIGDLDTSSNRIIINNSKNNKSRIIVISDSMRNVLEKYLSLVNPQKYLFEYKNNKINYSTIQKQLKYICNYFNLKITFHDFRHSMATNSFKILLSKGYTEKEILYYLHLYLGHKTINETEYYFYFNNVIKDNMEVKYGK